MRSHHPAGAPKKEQSSSLALSPKDSLKRQEASSERPISRAASSCSQSQEGKVKGIGRVMCGQKPLSHHPLALNREQGLHPQPGRTHGEEQKKGSRVEVVHVGAGGPPRKENQFPPSLAFCVASSVPPPLLGSGKCMALPSPGAPAPCALPVHMGPGIRLL